VSVNAILMMQWGQDEGWREYKRGTRRPAYGEPSRGLLAMQLSLASKDALWTRL